MAESTEKLRPACESTAPPGFQERVPADMTLHVGMSEWNGVGLDALRFHAVNDGATTPAMPHYFIGYVTSGCIRKASYRFGEAAFKATAKRAGSCVLMNRDTPLTWRWNDDYERNPPLQSVIIHLDPGLFRDAAVKCFDKTLDFCDLVSQVNHEDALIGQISLALQAEAAEPQSAFGNMYRETCAQLLAVHLLKYYFNRTFKPGFGRQTLQSRRLRTITDYIHDNLGARMSLTELAGLAGISEYYFAREFKRATGLAPHQYIIRRRIEEARRLLKHTDWSVLRIASELGYENHSHFAAVFKRIVGCSPSHFRRQNTQ